MRADWPAACLHLFAFSKQGDRQGAVQCAPALTPNLERWGGRALSPMRIAPLVRLPYSGLPVRSPAEVSGEITVDIFPVQGADKIDQVSLNPYSNAVIAKTNSVVVAFPFEFLEITDVDESVSTFNVFNDLFDAVEKSSVILVGS